MFLPCWSTWTHPANTQYGVCCNTAACLCNVPARLLQRRFRRAPKTISNKLPRVVKRGSLCDSDAADRRQASLARRTWVRQVSTVTLRCLNGTAPHCTVNLAAAQYLQGGTLHSSLCDCFKRSIYVLLPVITCQQTAGPAMQHAYIPSHQSTTLDLDSITHKLVLVHVLEYLHLCDSLRWCRTFVHWT